MPSSTEFQGTKVLVRGRQVRSRYFGMQISPLSAMGAVGAFFGIILASCIRTITSFLCKGFVHSDVNDLPG